MMNIDFELRAVRRSAEAVRFSIRRPFHALGVGIAAGCLLASLLSLTVPSCGGGNAGYECRSDDECADGLSCLAHQAGGVCSECSFSAPHMHPAASGAVTPDAAAATVVFVRPSRIGGAASRALRWPAWASWG